MSKDLNAYNKNWVLTPREELQSHTLQVKKYWADKITANEESETKAKKKKPMPSEWEMLKDINLHPWQKECVEAWFKNRRGTIKVVTGAGKTILALAIIEQLQQSEKDLRVAIVVPTIVLLNQWREELLEKSNLPDDAIGFMGGGYNDDLSGNKKIMVCVLKSASEKLPHIVNETTGEKMLLVVDECHRAGSTEMSKVFATKRKYNLGLSATPEREYYDQEADQIIDESGYDESLLGRELGPVVYEMTLKEAFLKGILPKFELRHYALPLVPKERNKYENLSRIIKELRDELKDQGSDRIRNENALFNWCQSVAKQDSQLGQLANQFISKSGERKRLLYNAKARSDAVIKLLKEELNNNPEARAILFHESIEEVMELYYKLVKNNIPVVVEHSQLPDSLRDNSIELFRKGAAKVIVSARSLIEGFNVPSADIGVIVASSTSVRQRIQTLGRVLRKPGSGSKEKKAVVYVLYMDNTTDEYIYEKTDWGNIIGADKNRYFYWDLKSEPEERSGPPREPKTKETDIDKEVLVEGEEYPGEYEGWEYSCDSAGNVFDDHKRPASNPQGIPDKVYKIKGGYGRFKVTPRNKFVLVIKKVPDGWSTVYVTTLAENFKFEKKGGSGWFNPDSAETGDEFPRNLVGETLETLYFKQSRGVHRIVKRHGRNEKYARTVNNAEDEKKGRNASYLIDKLEKLQEQGTRISKFFINENGHVVYLEDGQYRYITTLPEGLEFP